MDAKTVSDKKRSRNFTPYEKAFFFEIMQRYPIIEDKGNDYSIVSRKQQAWDQATREYNSNEKVSKRETLNLKSLWKNLKMKAKKEHANHKKELFQTGGGGPAKPLDKISEGIVGMIPNQFLPIQNRFDEDHVLETEGSQGQSLETPAIAPTPGPSTSSTLAITPTPGPSTSSTSAITPTPGPSTTSTSAITPTPGPSTTSTSAITPTPGPSTSAITPTPGPSTSSTAATRSAKKRKIPSNSENTSLKIAKNVDEFHELRLRYLKEEHDIKMQIHKNELQLQQEQHKVQMEILQFQREHAINQLHGSSCSENFTDMLQFNN